ncbi:MAG TPA: protein kinase, partial [Terriglobia bacterium]|nr:protein kinase [Terriglobia bacterium]
DIWAFGVVLYEMVTGRRLFQGEDLTDTLAAVVREKPDWSAAPAALRPLLEKCLEKDPKKRLRHISSFQLLVQKDASEIPEAKAEAPRSGNQWVAWVVAGLLGAGLVALATIHFREPEPRQQAVQFLLEAPASSLFINQYGGFAPSPDGRYVVFSARAPEFQGLWLRPLDSTVARPLPGTENANFPFWSPDSKSLGFYVNGKIKRIEVTGGAPLTLADASESPVTTTGAWNSNGVILFGGAGGLMRVPAAGGGATPLTKTDTTKLESGHGYPQFLPDGERFLYFIASSDTGVQGVYSSSLSAPDKRQQILRTAAKAVFAPARGPYPNYLLWMQDQALLAQEFDPATLKLVGDPVSVAEQVGLNPTTIIRASFWPSDSGLLIYFALPAQRKRSIRWFSRDGRVQSEAAPLDTFNRVALDPTGERVAAVRADTTGQIVNQDVWIHELRDGRKTRLTFNPLVDDIPVWSPDGKKIAFSSTREDSVAQIYRKDVSGAGEEEQLTQGPSPKLVLDWSQDGRYLLYREQNPRTNRDLMALPLEGDRKPIPIADTEFLESTGAISPDGKWVAYTSNDSGQNQLYIRAFPGHGGPPGRWQVSNGSAYELKWRSDGKEIYYQRQDQAKIMAVAIQAGPDGVRAETPRELFAAEFQRGSLHEFDATKDGQRFLMIINNDQAAGEAEGLTVISNWQATLRK